MTIYTWVRSRNCGCLVTWFCYQLIAKPGNKTATVSQFRDLTHMYILSMDMTCTVRPAVWLLQACKTPASDFLCRSKCYDTCSAMTPADCVTPAQSGKKNNTYSTWVYVGVYCHKLKVTWWPEKQANGWKSTKWRVARKWRYQAGKLKIFGTRLNWVVSYTADTKFHLPRPVFHSPGQIFTCVGER